MKSKEVIIQETMNWVNRVVIGLNFCPFAAPVVTHNQLHVKVITGNDVALLLEALIMECRFLDTSEQYETSLVVFPDFGSGQEAHFIAYLDLVELADQLLDKQSYRGVYQLATFHPDYCFAEAEKDDPANYTNRSPYPMVHIIPEESLEKAIASYPNVEEIPENNMKLTRQKGLLSMESMRKGCFVDGTNSSNDPLDA